MKITTSKILLNGQWREVLIYLSDTPLTFTNKVTHIARTEADYQTIVTVYTCENFIFRTYEPPQSKQFAYWFLIQSKEVQISEFPAELIEACQILLGEEE